MADEWGAREGSDAVVLGSRRAMPTCPRCLAAYPSETVVCPVDGATLVVPPDDPLIGASLVGRFDLRRRIGEGGMGVVYEATDTLIGRQVAIKVLHERHAARPEVAGRMMNEARLASSVHHDHVVDIFDVATTEAGRTFIVMELLDGETLASLIRREGGLSEARAIEIGLQVASALGAAHAKGIVHRDVKPENVFLSRRDGKETVKVVDFGISKAMRVGDEGGEPRLTQTGMVLGTPLYMSPEQARGEEQLDHRIDIYALGVILYECLTGEVPFRASNSLRVIAQVLSDEPTPPRALRPELRISEAMERVTLRAMAKSPSGRYPTMDALGGDLRRVVAGKSVDAPAVGRAVPVAPQRRNSGVTGLIAGIALAGAAGIYVAVMRSPSSPPPSAPDAASRPPPAVRASSPAPSPAPPSPTVTLRFASTPPGAEVRLGDRVLGLAGDRARPSSIAFNRGDGDVVLTFVHEGCERGATTVRPSVDGELVEMKLTPIHRPLHALPPPSPRRPLAQRPTPPASPDAPPAPSPYLKKN